MHQGHDTLRRPAMRRGKRHTGDAHPLTARFIGNKLQRQPNGVPTLLWDPSDKKSE